MALFSFTYFSLHFLLILASFRVFISYGEAFVVTCREVPDVAALAGAVRPLIAPFVGNLQEMEQLFRDDDLEYVVDDFYDDFDYESPFEGAESSADTDCDSVYSDFDDDFDLVSFKPGKLSSSRGYIFLMLSIFFNFCSGETKMKSGEFCCSVSSFNHVNKMKKEPSQLLLDFFSFYGNREFCLYMFAMSVHLSRHDLFCLVVLGYAE